MAGLSNCVVVESLEERRFLSAVLKVENLDVVPGYERMVFNRILYKNTTYPNYTKERGTLRLTNTGDRTLTFSNVAINGPFKLVNALPATLGVGKSVNITVQFTANKPPPYTYNQTNYYNRATLAGAYVGGLTFKTNDPSKPTYKEELAGWFQTKSEDNQEPGLQTIVNLIFNYKTNLAPARTVTLNQGTTAKYYGEEVKTGYWKVANPAKNVGIRQIAAFHSQGSKVNVGWFKKSDKVYRHTFTSSGLAGQSFLPYLDGQPSRPATGSFAPGGTTVFGFKIDKEWSDDKLNNSTGGGHHVRFYPLRDHFGNKLPNTYLMAMDYSVGNVQNYDTQDNVFILTNIKPVF